MRAKVWHFATMVTVLFGTGCSSQEFVASGTGTGSSTPYLSTPNVGIPGGIGVRGSSRIVSYGEGSSINAQVKLVRFKNGSVSTVSQLLSTTETPSFEPRGTEVAWSDNGAAVVWADFASGKGVIRSWVAGPNLCDAPIP